MPKLSSKYRRREYFFTLLGNHWMQIVMSFLTLLLLLDKFFNSYNYYGDKYPEVYVEWTDFKIVQAFICSIILIILPFVYSQKYILVAIAVSGCALIICTMFIENLFGRRQCLATYFASVIVFRVIHNQTFFDNFALCVAFSSNVGAISVNQTGWYTTANVLIWSYFISALITRHIYNRIHNRISDNLRALLLLQKNLKHELEKCKYFYEAHIPHVQNVQQPIIPPNAIKGSSSSHLTEKPGSDKSSAQTIATKPNTPQTSDEHILHQGKRLGLIPEIEDLSEIDVSLIPSKLEKKNAILIALRFMKGYEQECALSLERQHIIFDAINHHAAKFNIVHARCFGDVWIGYYERSDNSVAIESSRSRSVDTESATTPRPMDDNVNFSNRYYTSAHRVLSFCCEVDVMVNLLGTRIAVAIEQGLITMGHSISSQFNIYGQEIRWLLRVIDLEDYGHINISESFRSQISSDRKINQDIANISTERRQVEYPWKKGFPSQIMTVTNVNDYAGSKDELILELKEIMDRVSAPKLEVCQDGVMRLHVDEADDSNSCRDIMIEKSFSKRPPLMASATNREDSTGVSLGLFFGGKGNNNTGSGNSVKTGKDATLSTNAKNKKSDGSSFFGNAFSFADDSLNLEQNDILYHWQWFQAFESSEYWKESIGSEFKQSLEQRTGMSLQDPLLKSLRRDDLLFLLNKSERNLNVLIFYMIWYWVCNLPTTLCEQCRIFYTKLWTKDEPIVAPTVMSESETVQLPDTSIVTEKSAQRESPTSKKLIEEEEDVELFHSFWEDVASSNTWLYRLLQEEYEEFYHSRLCKIWGIIESTIGYWTSSTSARNDRDKVRKSRLSGKIYVSVMEEQQLQNKEEDDIVDHSSSVRVKPVHVSPRHSFKNPRPVANHNYLSSEVDAISTNNDTELWREAKREEVENPSTVSNNVGNNITNSVTPSNNNSTTSNNNKVDNQQHSKDTKAKQDINDGMFFTNQPIDQGHMSVMKLEDGTMCNTPTYTKYSRDIRMFFLHDMVNTAMELLLMVTALYPFIAIMTTSSPSRTDAIFRSLVFIHFIYSQTAGRVKFAGNSLVWITYHVIMMVVFPCSVLRGAAKNIYQEYGDFGGDAMLNIFCLLRLPASLNMNPLLVILDGFFMRGVLSYKDKWPNAPANCNLHVPTRNQSFYTFSTFVIFFVAIYFGTITSYILEHRILPAVIRKLQRARNKTQSITKAFYPRMHQSLNNLGPMSLYKGVTLLCIHVKALDAMCEYVDSRVVGSVAREIEKVMDSSFAECGLVKITEFSGVYIVTSARSLGLESDHRSHTNSYSIVHVIQKIRSKIEDLTKIWQFNIALGIALHVGDVYIGFNGFQRYCLDVVGSARDITMAMASHNSEGLFASRVFESEIQRLKPVDYLVHQQTVTQSGLGDAYWLCVDGTLAGMHLDDFLWLGKLGEGGYGMVHLAAEKYSKVRYAIKVIPLKQSNGLRMTNMMKQECLILQTMAHKNVVKLHYSFIDKDQLYLVMTYVKGGNLKQVIDTATSGFSISQLRNWFAELVLAIEYIHDKGIIHRDIKPANCMIDTNGHLRLADFGLSKKDNSVRDGAVWAELQAATMHHQQMMNGGNTSFEGMPVVEGLMPIEGIANSNNSRILSSNLSSTASAVSDPGKQSPPDNVTVNSADNSQLGGVIRSSTSSSPSPTISGFNSTSTSQKSQPPKQNNNLPESSQPSSTSGISSQQNNSSNNGSLPNDYWLTRQVQRTLQKFLPLKTRTLLQNQPPPVNGFPMSSPLYGTNNMITPSSMVKTVSHPADVHKNVTVLVLKRDAIFTERKRTYRFSNFSVNIISARDESEAESLLSLNQVDAIMIEMANSMEEAEMLASMSSELQGGGNKADDEEKQNEDTSPNPNNINKGNNDDANVDENNHHMLVTSVSLDDGGNGEENNETNNNKQNNGNANNANNNNNNGDNNDNNNNGMAEESAMREAAANNLQRIRDLVKHFCFKLLNTLPVYVYGVGSDYLRTVCIEAGAKDTFKDVTTGDILEPEWRNVFNIATNETMTEEEYDRHEERANNYSGFSENNSMDNSMNNSYGGNIPSFLITADNNLPVLQPQYSSRDNVQVQGMMNNMTTVSRSINPFPVNGYIENVEGSLSNNITSATSLKPVLKAPFRPNGASTSISNVTSSTNRRRVFSSLTSVNSTTNMVPYSTNNTNYPGNASQALNAHGYQQNNDDQDHIVGTVHFMAPEVIKKNSKHGASVDWWACGVTFYYCLTKKHLFAGEDRDTVFKAILNDPIDIASGLAHLEGSDRNVISLIEGLVCRDVTHRLGSRTIVMVSTYMEEMPIPIVNTNNSTNNGGSLSPKVQLPITDGTAIPVPVGNINNMDNGTSQIVNNSLNNEMNLNSNPNNTNNNKNAVTIHSQPMLYDGVARIKEHPFFEGIDWETVSSSDNNTYKPGQYPPKSSDPTDKAKFYGEYDSTSYRYQSPHVREMELRSSFSMKRFSQNKQRIKNSKHSSKNSHATNRKHLNIASNPLHFAKMKKIISGQIQPEPIYPAASSQQTPQGSTNVAAMILANNNTSSNPANGGKGGVGSNSGSGLTHSGGHFQGILSGGAASGTTGNTANSNMGTAAKALTNGFLSVFGGTSGVDSTGGTVGIAVDAPPGGKGVTSMGGKMKANMDGLGVLPAGDLGMSTEYDLVLHDVIEEDEEVDDEEDEEANALNEKINSSINANNYTNSKRLNTINSSNTNNVSSNDTNDSGRKRVSSRKASRKHNRDNSNSSGGGHSSSGESLKPLISKEKGFSLKHRGGEDEEEKDSSEIRLNEVLQVKAMQQQVPLNASNPHNNMVSSFHGSFDEKSEG